MFLPASIGTLQPVQPMPDHSSSAFEIIIICMLFGSIHLRLAGGSIMHASIRGW